MSEKASKEKAQEIESLILVSPAGHKYEISVSDAGTLITTLKGNK